MSNGTSRRAKNSLSRKKFIDRLNRGLPIFVAHAGEKNGIYHYEDCRQLHWHAWLCPTTHSAGGEFVYITKRYPTWTSKNVIASLNDMNVNRNKYNKIFIFRTQKAAGQYMRDGV